MLPPTLSVLSISYILSEQHFNTRQVSITLSSSVKNSERRQKLISSRAENIGSFQKFVRLLSKGAYQMCSLDPLPYSPLVDTFTYDWNAHTLIPSLMDERSLNLIPHRTKFQCVNIDNTCSIQPALRKCVFWFSVYTDLIDNVKAFRKVS